MDRTSLLLIEDDDTYALLVREHLEQYRPGMFDLQHVVRLAAGLERLVRGGVDVVLLDLTLPDSHGLDTYVTVRSHAPEVPVVVLSGVDDEQLAIQAAREGAQDYLVKGRVRGDTLVRCLVYAIERQQALVKLKRYARQASASESRFRRIIEQNADGIVISDPSGDVLFANVAALQMLGEAADDIRGRPFRYALTPGKTSEVILGDDSLVAEMRVTETRWNGDPALLASLRDVTERKRNRELQSRFEAEALLVNQLRDLDRMKSDFVRNVTDEFVAPLTPLGAAVATLLDGSQGSLNERQREVLELVHKHVGGLSRLAHGVQTLSRLDAGDYEIHPQPVSLGEILAGVVEGTRPQAERRDVEMTLQGDADVIVFADPGEVTRVLQHLLDNAVNHNPSGTKIQVGVERVEAGRVEVSVEDTGRGLPGQARDHVFDRFRTGEGSTLGLGIGLALCDALVGRMGGAMSVESRVGEGSTFRFTLPVK